MVKWICQSVLMAIIVLSGCADDSPKVKQNLDADLILNSKFSIPIDRSHTAIRAIRDSVILSYDDHYISYRWIAAEEIKFIGSEKMPYDFFTSALTSPKQEVEIVFLEGLGKVNKRAVLSRNNIDYYILDVERGTKIYMLSKAVDFVVEISSKSLTEKEIEKIVESSKLK